MSFQLPNFIDAFRDWVRQVPHAKYSGYSHEVIHKKGAFSIMDCCGATIQDGRYGNNDIEQPSRGFKIAFNKVVTPTADLGWTAHYAPLEETREMIANGELTEHFESVDLGFVKVNYSYFRKEHE